MGDRQPPQPPDLSSLSARALALASLCSAHQAADGAHSLPPKGPYPRPTTTTTSSPLSSPPPSPIRPPSTPAMPRGVKHEETMPDAAYMPNAPLVAMGKLPDLAANGMAGSSALPPGAENIVIKNHFPVARIKRIMQADDDVGKVAQVTPVVVSKALELFMISLVSRAAAEAKSRNSKRVGAIHLKQAITKNEQFDFLNDIVSKVADAPEKTEDAGDAEGKKRKTPGRRKKKADDDDDF